MPNPTPSDKLKSMAKQAVEDQKGLGPDVDKWAEKVFSETTSTDLAMVIAKAMVTLEEIPEGGHLRWRVVAPGPRTGLYQVKEATDRMRDETIKALAAAIEPHVAPLVAQNKRLRAVAEAAKVLVYPIKYGGEDTAYRRNILKITLDALEVGDE